MATQQEIEVYSYSLNIQSIKMKVKFACKMKLEYNGMFTPEVSQNDAGKFIFNHEITLKEDTSHSHFEIVAHIATDKGAKYIAGVIKLMQSELVHQEGEMLVVSLSKCIDQDASCELRVDQVSSEKAIKKAGLDPLRSYQFRETRSPGSTNSPIRNATKSEYQIPLNLNPNRDRSDRFGKDHQSNYNGSRSPDLNFKRSKFGAAQHLNRISTDIGAFDNSNRDKLIQAEVYKQSYQKLREKYKRESQNAKHELNRRLALESAENNYKIEIMRLKLKSEEQEKSIADKNARLREYQVQLASLQKKQLDLQYLKEQNSNKDHTIRMLEQTIRTLNRDNEDLKSLNKERFEGQQGKIRQLRNEIDSIKLKFQTKILDLEREIKQKADSILQKDSELKMRDERLERQQRFVEDLEKAAQIKMIEFQKSIQAQKQDSKNKQDSLKEIIARLEADKRRLQEQLEDAKGEQEKVKSFLVKIEYDKKLSTQQNDTYKAQLNELKAMKTKYQQLNREHRLLVDDKNHLQKQYDKAISTRETSISDMTKQHQQQIEHYKKIYRQIDDKLKNIMSKNLQLQTTSETRKNQSEKYRRLNENLSRELAELKDKERAANKNIKQKQQQISNLSMELDSYKNKMKSGDQSSRFEIDNLKEELATLKREYSLQATKAAQYSQKNSNMTIQINKLKMKIQYAEDQAEKTSQIHRDKVQSLENTIRQHERKTADLDHQLKKQKNIEKQNQTKIQSMEIESLKTRQKIDRLTKDIKVFEDKIQQHENTIKIKQNQIAQLQQSKQLTDKKLQETEDKLGETRNSCNTVTGEKKKNEKIIELLNKDIAEGKRELEKAQKMIADKEKVESELRDEIKKGKEEYLKLEIKSNSLKKEFQKFKDNLFDTLSMNYSQLPLSHDGSSTDLKRSKVELLGKRSVTHENSESGIFNSDIINKITQQNKDIKSNMNKLIEQNRSLQKQIEQLNQEMVQISQKAQSNEQNLNKQVQGLEQDLQKIYVEKQQSAMTMGEEILGLKATLEQKHEIIRQLQTQIQELSFTVNSLKMDDEAKTEHSNFKQTQMKTKLLQLQEKITFLTNLNEQLQFKNAEYYQIVNEKTEEIENERELLNKKEKEYELLLNEKNRLFEFNEGGKKHKNELFEKISQLELKLSTEIESKEKLKQLLDDEERKGAQLKEFVASLMKQKQQAIKGDLQKGEQLIVLENQVMELTRDKQILQEDNERKRKSLEEMKTVIKKMNSQMKDSELMGAQQKIREQKLSQKLKQSQRALVEMTEQYNKLQEQTNKLTTKTNKQINDLQSQVEGLYKLKEGVSTDMHERINQLTREIRDYKTEITTLKTEVSVLEETLFRERHNNEVKQDEISRLTEELNDSKRQVKSLQESIKKMNDELKEKEQGWFEMSGQVYNLETKLEALEKEKNNKIEETIEDWSSKYDMVCDEYEQRIQLVEKEKNYFKSRLDEKQEQFKKIMADLRNSQLDDVGLKKVLQDKIRRLEEERLSAISSKNAQIQKLAEQNKDLFDSIKNREADMRRIQHELEVARSTIAKLENNKRETEQKIKHINKVYQGELDQLKKKQALTRTSREQLSRVQWDIEKQIKKTFQNYSKTMISGQSKQVSQKLVGTIKGMEQEIIRTVNTKLGDKAA